MSDKKEIKEIDVASLDSELAAARTLEEGKGDKFIMMASVVAFLMTSFHIYTGFFGLFDYSVQRGVHLGFALTLILLTQPLYKHVFKDKFAGSKAFRAACRTFDMILVVLTWVSVWMAQDEVHHLTERLSKTTWMATFAGACLVIIVLECARRTLGLSCRFSRSSSSPMRSPVRICPWPLRTAAIPSSVSASSSLPTWTVCSARP